MHIGHFRGRQPGHSEMSSLLAEDVNGPAAAGVARWGALCKEGVGSAETLQEFSATVMFLFLYLTPVTIYLPILSYP